MAAAHLKMNKETIKSILARMFVPRAEGLEGKCFRSEFMDRENEAYAVQQAVSDALHGSGLSFDFSYRIAEKACDILAKLEDWEDDDAITEAADAIVPVYTSELMTIYASDSWAVDETRKEIGDAGDSIKQASYAWYVQIRDMVEAIKNNLSEVEEKENAS